MYSIPGDKQHPWRLNKFIDYHALGDADMNFPLLIKYADRHELSNKSRFWFAFLYSTCYCVATTCYLYEQLDIMTVTPKQVEDFWVKNKSKMIFQSDKRYVKNMDWFVTLVVNYLQVTDRNPVAYFKAFRGDTPQDTYNHLYKHLLTWRYFGRFTTFLFIEAMSKLTPLKSDSNWFDWKNGNTATSGMLHILYLDQEAADHDAGKGLSPEVIQKLQKSLTKLKRAVAARYPEASTNIVDLETALCGFRKLFKQSRYGGYYIDRVQDEINAMTLMLPEQNTLWNQLWEFRKEAFNPLFLGEIQGYNGLQKARNSEWVARGVSGVEIVSEYTW